MKIIVFLFSFILCFSNRGVFAQLLEVKIPNTIDKTMSAFRADEQVLNASISFYVYDIDNKIMVSEYQPKASLSSASTMKLVTTASALEILGSYHKFETKIQYDGRFDSITGVLHGNIYIKGGGDPTLGSRYYTNDTVDIMKNWVQAIQAIGIKEVRGRVIGDATFFSDEFVPSNWSWGDLGADYGAGVSGLSIYDNIQKVWFNGGLNFDDTTEITCYEPYTPDLTFDNRVRTGQVTGDEVYMYGAPYDSYRIIKGRVPKMAKDLKVTVSMHEPDYVASYEFQHKLIQAGIVFKERPTTLRRLKREGISVPSVRVDVFSVYSPAVSSIVYWTNLISNNLFAEHLLKHIGLTKSKDASVYSSTAAIDKFWRSKGVDMSGFYMNDGSGLSRANAFSAKHIVEMLVYMRTKSKYWGSFESSLPSAGKTGTLKNIGKGTKLVGNLKAKTGTMTRVKSFAGYVKSASGKKLAFAFTVNNFNCTTEEMGKKMEKVLISLGEYNQ